MFTGVGYGIMETWTEKSTCVNIIRNGKPIIDSVFRLWRGLDTMLKQQNKKQRALLRIRHIAGELDLRLCNIMEASVLVVGKLLVSFYVLTTLRTMGQHIGKTW